MEVETEEVIKKPKRLTSIVWNHFERVKNVGICYAVCVHCNKKLSGSSNSGTTHLRNHLMRCLKRSNCDVSQLLTAKRRRKDTTVTVAKTNYDEVNTIDENFCTAVIKNDEEQSKDEKYIGGGIKVDQERSRLDLARMIILHGYPLTMVEDVGFKEFVKNLQPLFEIGPNCEIEVACMELYGKEKHRVFEMIQKLHSKMNLAVYMWTSQGNLRYLSLNAYYIDDDWRLQNKILNFVTLDSSLTEDMLSEVIIKCLMEWNIDRKLFAITFDDIFTNDDNVLRIKDWLSQSKPLPCDGLFFDVRCATNVLRSIIQYAMETLQDVTQKVRDSVRHVKSSQAIQQKFKEISQQIGINSQTTLFLDSPPQWDSTYYMLKAAVEYKAAFVLFQELDITYTTVLTDKEWERVTSISGYLKVVVNIISVLSTSKYVTANMYFPEICELHIQLLEWCKNPDDFIGLMALKMKTKFDNYWNKCSLLVIAVILDPRFKMKLIEYYYPQIYGSSSSDRIKDVSKKIYELFEAYSIGLTSSSVDQDSTFPSIDLPSTSDDRLKGFDKFVHETTQNESIITDLDKYIAEPVFPRHIDFDILNWWKVNTAKYPVLSFMARDILSIPMATAAPEYAFSSEGRVLDHHRSSLNQDAREALICSQDWLWADFAEPKPSSSRSTAFLV